VLGSNGVIHRSTMRSELEMDQAVRGLMIIANGNSYEFQKNVLKIFQDINPLIVSFNGENYVLSSISHLL